MWLQRRRREPICIWKVSGKHQEARREELQWKGVILCVGSYHTDMVHEMDELSSWNSNFRFDFIYYSSQIQLSKRRNVYETYSAFTLIRCFLSIHSTFPSLGLVSCVSANFQWLSYASHFYSVWCCQLFSSVQHSLSVFPKHSPGNFLHISTLSKI